MRYVKAKSEEYRQELTYRIYVTDFMCGFGGNVRWADMVFQEKEKEVEPTTIDEDVDRIWSHIG